MADPMSRIRALPIWSGPPEIEPLGGGLTNKNFKATDGTRTCVVRLGDDIPVHHLMRFNELAAARAAHEAGISPAVVHAEAGLLVIDHIQGRTFAPDDVRQPQNLARIVPLIRTCHRKVQNHLSGPILIFWVFHVIGDYVRSLGGSDTPHAPVLADLKVAGARLEAAAGPFDIVFAHNDLLAANIIDDGDRLWLIDWDYGGFNTPLFDLGGLASNNELPPDQERWLLEAYFGAPASDELWRRYQAMKCASLLRETLWSMVSEIHSTLDFDYAAYTAENLRRFETAYADFKLL